MSTPDYRPLTGCLVRTAGLPPGLGVTGFLERVEQDAGGPQVAWIREPQNVLSIPVWGWTGLKEVTR